MAIPAHIAMILVALVAAVVDHRTGRIPNWITFPVIVIGPLLWLTVSGDAGMASLLAVLVCGGAPYVMFRANALGGGDVKLFAALGALGGVQLGFASQMYALVFAMLFVLVATAVRGQLVGILANAARMLWNRVTPRRCRKPVVPATLHELRLGPAILAGTLFAVAAAHGLL